MGVLEVHTWGSKNKQVERPDRLTFDIDPDPAVPWPLVIEAAKTIKERLADIGLGAFIKTTGGKGFHVVVPIAPKGEWDEIKEFSRLIVETIVQESPDRYVSTMSKAARKNKIYIDYLRNARGATAVAAYSTRARKNAPVSVPLRWEELKVLTRPDRYNVHNLPDRLSRLRKDPWTDYESARRALSLKMKKNL
jgi:bifunctional non-homologous end joining protein LigD